MERFNSTTQLCSRPTRLQRGTRLNLQQRENKLFFGESAFQKLGAYDFFLNQYVELKKCNHRLMCVLP